MEKKIITIVGARPQFIKAATLSRRFKKYNVDEKIVHTGQHFDENMSAVFFKEMDIPLPAYCLNIHSLSHGAMTGRMIEGVENVLIKEKPYCVLVYGDTNSTLAGALAAAKLQLPVVHVEAGLRSFNRAMPEEMNRILTDRMSSYLFCPTDAAVQNLQNEGFDNFPVKIVKNGDVMQDAAIFYAQKATGKSTIMQALKLENFVVATIHRQENTDDGRKLRGIMDGLNRIDKTIPVVVPLHPRTKKIVAEMNIRTDFRTIDPVGYFDMLTLLKNCRLVITDSGGMQKEAFFFKKYCITLRDETEWIELVEKGFNRLTEACPDKIYRTSLELLDKPPADFDINLYGNGRAAEIAAEFIAGL
jgi:UDP-GlcNAc3NAcA epimerase